MYGAIESDDAAEVPQDHPARRVAKAAGLVFVALGAVAAAGSLPARASTLVASGGDATLQEAFEIVQHESFDVSCTDNDDYPYVDCEDAVCSVLGENNTVVACSCERVWGEFSLEISTNADILKSQTVRNAIVALAHGDGSLSESANAAFCTALVDGTVCSEMNENCEILSLAPVKAKAAPTATRLLNAADAAPLGDRDASDPDLRAKRALQDKPPPGPLVIPWCMGAICYSADVEGPCDVSCLCVVDPNNMQENPNVPEGCAGRTSISWSGVPAVHQLFDDMDAAASRRASPTGACTECKVQP